MPQDKEHHIKQVDAWIERTTKGLPSIQLVPIYAEAIETLQKRISNTLSEVTLTALLDRVLSKTRKKYPLLTKIKIEPKGISLNGLLSEANSYSPEQITEAFRLFLIELLTILANLTAGVMTKPLYKELHQVTAERVPLAASNAGPQSLNHSRGSKEGEET